MIIILLDLSTYDVSCSIPYKGYWLQNMADSGGVLVISAVEGALWYLVNTFGLSDAILFRVQGDIIVSF